MSGRNFLKWLLDVRVVFEIAVLFARIKTFSTSFYYECVLIFPLKLVYTMKVSAMTYEFCIDKFRRICKKCLWDSSNTESVLVNISYKSFKT
jgi:hypothetical protein